jgi:hypothetical protein
VPYSQTNGTTRFFDRGVSGGVTIKEHRSCRRRPVVQGWFDHLHHLPALDEFYQVNNTSMAPVVYFSVTEE